MDLSLYALTVLIWGTSWLAIKFQLGVVAPERRAAVVFQGSGDGLHACGNEFIRKEILL